MEGPAVSDGRQWHDRRAVSNTFGVIVVPDPVCLVYGGSGDPQCTAHTMLAMLVSQGTAVLEARRAATLGWSMAPDPSYLSSSGGLKLQFYKVEVQLMSGALSP